MIASTFNLRTPEQPLFWPLRISNFEIRLAEVPMMANPRWHALQVRPRFERIVALRLRERGIEQYLPLHKITRNGTRSIELPLFPGYVFCKYDGVAVSSFWDIPGALWLNVVPETQITDLRRILAAGVSVQPCPFTSQGRIVMVEDGPLSGVVGILRETADERLLVVSIQLIRRSIAVNIGGLSRISFRPLHFHSESHTLQADLRQHRIERRATRAATDRVFLGKQRRQIYRSGH